MGSVFKHSPFLHTPVSFPQWYHCGIILHLSQAASSYSSLPTQSFLPAASPQLTPYHNASRWAEVQLNDKPILPGQEGDPGGWYKEEGPGDHRLIWLPPRRQDAEDFQLLLRLKLMMERRGRVREVTAFSPGPDFQTQNDWLYFPQPNQVLLQAGKMTRQNFPCEILWARSLAPPRIGPLRVSLPSCFQHSPKKKNRSLGSALMLCMFLGLTSISWGVACTVWCR